MGEGNNLRCSAFIRSRFILSLTVFTISVFLTLACSKHPPRQIPEVIRFEQRYMVDKNHWVKGEKNYITCWDIQRNMKLWTLKLFDQPASGKQVSIVSLSVGHSSILAETDGDENFELHLRHYRVTKITPIKKNKPKEKTCECKCLQKK